MILSNAAEIVRLNKHVRETYKLRDQGAESLRAWKAACQELHARYDALAFPGGYNGALERIEVGDPNTVEAAICFLEIRPYFFRSGYMYEKVLRKVKRAKLLSKQAERLEAVIQADRCNRNSLR